MNAVEWNKKEELVADQAMKHLKHYAPLMAALTSNTKSELALLLKVQEYCYDNMNFLKAFQKIVVLFYKSKSRFKISFLLASHTAMMSIAHCNGDVSLQPKC